MNRRLLLAFAAALPLAAACAPLTQSAGRPDLSFKGPALLDDAVVSFDGARLGLMTWLPDGDPWAVIVGLHGMNDYSNSYHLAAPYWASQGIATYAIDQRGFGRSPGRGVWAGEALILEDVRTTTALVRARYPKALIVVAGISMGGAAAIAAFASDRPPDADRVVLLAPAVWGWSSQPLPYKTALWITAHTLRSTVVEPPRIVTDNVFPSDNREELIAMGRDPLMTWGARPDTLYGLVSLMETAWASTGKIKKPVLYLYGDHDQVIPKTPSYQAAARLKKTDRTGFYADGYHLLLIDRQAPKVWMDVVAWLKDPKADLPSGVPSIPRPKGRNS